MNKTYNNNNGENNSQNNNGSGNNKPQKDMNCGSRAKQNSVNGVNDGGADQE